MTLVGLYVLYSKRHKFGLCTKGRPLRLVSNSAQTEVSILIKHV